MTNYEIRDKDDSGIFISFDTLPKANKCLADMKASYPNLVIENGMHVFKHEFKTELEQYQDTGLTPAEVAELAQASLEKMGG